jgi:integrase
MVRQALRRDVDMQLFPYAAPVSGQRKYSGVHALRHLYASRSINQKADGGLELPIKVVQGRLGHASINMTADVYGHLVPAR